METKNIIFNKYRGKLLGVGTRSDDNYFLDDFLKADFLVQFIVNTYDHETTFTKDGFDFLEEYYGLDNIIEMVLKEYPDYPFEHGVLSPKQALLYKKEYSINNSGDNKEK